MNPTNQVAVDPSRKPRKPTGQGPYWQGDSCRVSLHGLGEERGGLRRGLMTVRVGRVVNPEAGSALGAWAVDASVTYAGRTLRATRLRETADLARAAAGGLAGLVARGLADLIAAELANVPPGARRPLPINPDWTISWS